MPRRASAAWKPGSALICSVFSIHSSAMSGGCTAGTRTFLITAASSSETVITQVCRVGRS